MFDVLVLQQEQEQRNSRDARNVGITSRIKDVNSNRGAGSIRDSSQGPHSQRHSIYDRSVKTGALFNTATIYLFRCNFSHLDQLPSDPFGVAFPVDLYSYPNLFPLISSFLRIKKIGDQFFLYTDPGLNGNSRKNYSNSRADSSTRENWNIWGPTRAGSLGPV